MAIMAAAVLAVGVVTAAPAMAAASATDTPVMPATSTDVDGNTGYTLAKVRVASPTDPTPATGAVKPGDTVYYEVTVTNHDDADSLTDVTVTDTPGTGLTCTDANADQGDVTGVDTGVVSWEGWEIDPDGTDSMVVTCTVNGDATGTVVNTAATPESTASVSTPVEKSTPAEDITVHKSTDGTITTDTDGNSYVTYDVTVINNGSAESDDVVVNDNPSGLEYAGSYAEAPAGVTVAPSGEASATITVDKLAGGSSVTVKGLKFRLLDSSTVGYSNTVSLADNRSYALSKQRVTDATGETVATGTVQSGQTVYYKVMLSNTGGTEIPAGLKVGEAFEGLIYIGNDLVKDSDGNLVWSAPAIPSGQNRYVVLQFKVNDGVSMVQNTATTPHTEVVVTDPVAQYQVDKTLTSYDKDDNTAVYQITVKNTNNVAGKNVKIVDTATNLDIPDGYACTISEGEKIIGTATYDAATNQFNLSSVPAGATVTIDDITLASSDNRDITDFPVMNSVTTVDGAQKYDLTKVLCDADGKVIDSDSVVAVKPGDNVYYLVTVINKTDDTLDSVNVTDKPGTGLTLTAAKALGGTATLDGNVISWTTGAIVGGGRVSMVVTATVDAGASGSVTNYAKTPDHAVVTTVPVSPTPVPVPPTPVTDAPSVTKTVIGDAPAATYSFTLKAVDGAPMPGGGTSGSKILALDAPAGAQTGLAAAFGDISFAEAGIYVYTVAEVNGGSTIDDVAYDASVYTITYDVKLDAATNSLSIADKTIVRAAGDGTRTTADAMSFTNTYTKPVEPDTPGTPGTTPVADAVTGTTVAATVQGLPETGDRSLSGTPTLVALGALALVVGLVVLRRSGSARA